MILWILFLMTDMIIFKGLGTALVTPFWNSNVDYDAYVELVKRQVRAGVDFIVPLGTTAETPCLTPQEKLDLIRLTKENAGACPLLVGVGTNNLQSTIDNIKLFENKGADAFLVVTPYYNKPTQEGLYEYYKMVASATTKPIVLYNVPGRTGVNMTAKTTLSLAKIDNIVAIKEASGNYAQISEIIRSAPKNFTILSGNDDETLALMATGAHGIISVASNIAPEHILELTKAMLAMDLEKARVLHHQLSPLFKNCFIESNPIPVKAGLAAMGLIKNELRLPLMASTAETYLVMKETINALGLL